MNSYTGKLLIVDLTTGTTHAEPLNENYAAQYIGGAGLAARYLYDAIDARTDPLGADNPLIFMTGPLDATAAPSAGRFVVVARSPLTGIYGEANAGNFFGPDLKLAGYDGIIVRGKSPTPVYLLIRDGKAELRDAKHLRGKTTFDTGDALRAELNDPKLTVAAIGPAGENLVKYALILATNSRPGAKKGIAGRCGMGAVMGSKNLKAIAVRAGNTKITVRDPAAFQAALRPALEMLSDDNITLVWRAVGTAGTLDYLALLGAVPAKYWTQSALECEKISGNTLAETLLTGTGTCHACMVACGRKVARAAGHTLPHAEGPELETVVALGALLLNDDLELITYIGSQCDSLGLDSISTGSTMAFATYLREQGLLPASAGFDLHWSDPQQALQLVERIARREGIGAVLAEGSKHLGTRYGCEALAVQVNGLELAMHDPRALSGMALVYATSPIGGSHNQSDYYMVDASGKIVEELNVVAMDRFETEGKAANVARHQDWRAVTASLVQCIFPNPPVSNIVAMLAAATGYDITTQNVLTYGERIWNLKRALNLKLGYDARASEKMPELLLHALAAGGTAGHIPPLAPMLREYYAQRDWDWASGKPSRNKLRALGMKEVAQDLWG